MKEKTYIAIDLKSFYASVECVDRGLNPLDANLVVADPERTEKTICLAVTPALKALGVPGRPRLFEVVEKVREINASRRTLAPGNTFTGKGYGARELAENPSLQVDYYIASPRIGHYMDVSKRIYEIYLRYIAPEDIHVYSVDEVFMDVTGYLHTYGLSARELAMKLVREVLLETGITATAGVGSNLYLAKIAMDVMAKKMKADKDGVRIAELDERSYRENLWDHRPLKDFWRIGRGTAKKLENMGLMTMGDIARCSLKNEELLYKLFGINAELLIDHAWGYEPCTMADIKSYRSETNSLSIGQVLSEPYSFEKGRIIVREMTEQLALNIVRKGLVTNALDLTVCYDTENLTNPEKSRNYAGPVTRDFYGREVPKPAHGACRLKGYTASTKEISEKMAALYDENVDRNLTIRKVYVVVQNVIPEKDVKTENYEQLDLFTDYEARDQKVREEKKNSDKEKSLQRTILEIREKFGSNALVKGLNLEEGATGLKRNGQIGGHKADGNLYTEKGEEHHGKV